MNINKTRGILYKLANFLGDILAVSNRKLGKATKRITRRKYIPDLFRDLTLHFF